MTDPHSSQRLRLYLIRHGEVEGTKDGRVFGQTDVALSERGLEQSRQLADRLVSARLGAVYTSDLQRASQAAEMIADRHGLKMQPDSAWREINMGEWEGRSMSVLHIEASEQVKKLFTEPASFSYPGGESFAAFNNRIQEALNQLLARHRSGEIALVTHGGVCRTIIGHVLGMSTQNLLRLAQDYGSLNVIDWYGSNPTVKRLNHSAS